ncbi:uncharacterized protein LOC132921978 [Rhopalosiphum padi]|uniref:uncharacterized protein LOC132921978 n=1 Tax=Rhopalosiphum padi TaxID=40932 RepID=UPI00298DDB83|nr:uncharacterized protein LOC132921978 [Rhopalosiphum padi]
MAPKLLWITIIHVLLWNFIFSVTESIELNGAEDLLSNNFRDRVRFTTHICDHLKNLPPPAAYNNNDEPLSDSDSDGNFENPGLVKNLRKSLNPVKRHASLRCYNLHTQENNEPNKPDPSITNEWQMKSTPVNNAFGANLQNDLLVAQKPKVVELKKIDINFHKMVHQEPLYSTVSLLQKGNLIGDNPKYVPNLQLNLQDKTNKIKSLISAPQHKLVDVIPVKLLDESLQNKFVKPPLTFPSPSKFIKSPVSYSLFRPTEVHNNNDNVAVLTTDNDKQSNPSKLIPLSPHNIPNKDVYQQDSLIEKKPLLSAVPFIQINKPKPVEILDDKRVPPIAYRPTSPQYIKVPVIKPVFVPIFMQKEVSISPANEQPQTTNFGLKSQPKITKNGIAESTSQPNLIEKEVSISLPYKKPQGLIDLLSPPQYIKTSDTEIVHKPIAIEKEVSISEPNVQQKQPIIDLPPQTPIFIRTPDKDSLNPAIPGKTIVSVNAPYEQKPSIISLLSPPQVTETFNSESTSQIIPIQNEVSTPASYVQQQPLVNFSPPPPQFQQIKIQKEISIPLPLPYQQQKIGVPLKLVNSFNSELLSQTISQKKNSLYDQQKPIILPSPPPLIKTTTSAYANYN